MSQASDNADVSRSAISQCPSHACDDTNIAAEQSTLVADSSGTATDSNRDATDAFADLCLSSFAALEAAERVKCPGACGRRRRYWCGECLIPLVPEIPVISLPIRFDVLQSHCESPCKSTAQPASLLSKSHIFIWRSMQALLDSIASDQSSSTALLFPSPDALPVGELSRAHTEIKRVLVIDAPWPKAARIVEECKEIGCLPKFKLTGDVNCRYWRYPPKRGALSEVFSPDKMNGLVSTVEAIHACSRELGAKAQDIDNVLWFFAFQYSRVSQVYHTYPGKRARIERKSKGVLRGRF